MVRGRTLQIVIVAALAGLVACLALLSPGNRGPVSPQGGPPRAAREAAMVSDLAGGPERDNRVLGEFDLARIYPDLVLRQGRAGRKTVALTFDDGPDNQYTPQVLDALARKGVKATFFLIGKRLPEAPAVVNRMISEGHAVGNHTFSHPNVVRFTPEEISSEIVRGDEALRRFGVKRSGMFRPPYGAINVSSVEAIAAAGYRLYLWSVDSLDWRGLTAQQVVQNVVPLAADGSVILMHSAGGPGEDLSGTVQALPVIIDQLRAMGFTFATIPEMFPAGPGQAG